MKYSKIAGTLRWSQGTMVLHRGQSIDDQHPLAVERPDLFDDTEPGAEIKAAQRVESGTQRPGENRMERVAIKAPPRGNR